MNDAFVFNADRGSYTIEIKELDTVHRILIPQELVNDELGDDADEPTRIGWLRTNLPQILQASTAKHSGGFVKAPWGRLLVEEIN